MLEETTLHDLRNYLKDKVAYVEYQIGDTSHRAEINTASVLANGRIDITFTLDAFGQGQPITEIRLYDRNGNRLAKKMENISRESAQEGILYRYMISIMQEEGEG